MYPNLGHMLKNLLEITVVGEVSDQPKIQFSQKTLQTFLIFDNNLRKISH